MQDNIPAAGVGEAFIAMDSIAEMATSISDGAVDSIQATYFNDLFTAADGASIFDHANLTAAKGASIFDHANLTIAKIISLIDHANLTHAKTSSIMNHANFAGNAQKGQEIFDGSADNSVFTNGNHISEMLDDWNDNKLTSRDNAATTATGFTDRFGKTFRPEWATTFGTPTAVGGELVLDVDDAVDTPITFNVGSWEFKFTRVATTASALLYFRFGGVGKYHMAGTSATLSKVSIYDRVDSTDVISAAITVDTAPHTLKATRDAGSNWELFYDGASKGTGNDATTTSFDALVFGTVDGSTVNFDNLKVW